MAACVFLHPIYTVSGRIMDRAEKRAGHEFGLRISLWKSELAYYWNLNVNSAVKGHKDTTEICELQAANWCRISNGAPLNSKLHTYWAHITFDIRRRWQSFLQSGIWLNGFQKKLLGHHLRCVVSLLAYDPFNYLIMRYLISAWHRNWVKTVVTTGLFSFGLWLRYELQPLCGSVRSQCPSQTF